MMIKQTYCNDILHKITAAQAALNSVSRVLLESHINTCVITRLKEEDPDIVKEFLTTISKITK
ncbi:metal-sensing transcriptional repressor [Cytobacillus sp.]|uniref:metal-sensing transcriptional repressor n=1 Tax=Cytobacillus sp. TaxID=2675269 RepID=UPI003514569F